MKSTVETTCEGQPLSLSVEIHVRDSHYLLKSTVDIIIYYVEFSCRDSQAKPFLEIIN